MSSPEPEGSAPQSSLFGPPTRHSLVQRLGRAPSDEEQRRADWEWFLKTYERPMRTVVRRNLARLGLSRTLSHIDPDDAVQDVWLKLLRSPEVLGRWDAAQGRFRMYLQGVIANTCRALGGRSRVQDLRERSFPEDVDPAIDADAPAHLAAAEENTWHQETAFASARMVRERMPRSADQALAYTGLHLPELPVPMKATVSREDLLQAVCAEAGTQVAALNDEARALKMNAIDKGLGRAREAFWGAARTVLSFRGSDPHGEEEQAFVRFVAAAYPRLMLRDA